MSEYIRVDDDFEPEIVPERVVWLSDEQFELVDELFEKLTVPGNFEFHLVLGVAGTGKTQVLLSLADDLREAGKSVTLNMSDSLKKSLLDAGFQIRTDNPRAGSIHLVDDPGSVDAIASAIDFAKSRNARALIVTVDPFQWTDSRAILKFAVYFRPEMGDLDVLNRSNILKKFRGVKYDVQPELHWLRTVYRQSSEAGEKALELSKQIFERMNPYIHGEKQEEFRLYTQDFVERMLVEVDFHSPGGELIVVNTYEPEKELWHFISKHVARKDRWNWTESALIVPQVHELSSKWSDYSIPIPGFTDQEGFDPHIELQDVLSRLKIRFCLYQFPQTVRGEEFQDVLVSIPKNLWRLMNKQKSGLGSTDWSQIMPLHVYTTRARDSIRILVTDQIPF